MSTIFCRLTPGRYVRIDQVAAIVEHGDGMATLTLLSGAEVKAPEITARKVLRLMQQEHAKVTQLGEARRFERATHDVTRYTAEGEFQTLPCWCAATHNHPIGQELR